jgi:hypothetical protein
MSLQQTLDAFKANFEAGGPPHHAPSWIHEPMHRATDELIASGADAEVNPDYTVAPIRRSCCRHSTKRERS